MRRVVNRALGRTLRDERLQRGLTVKQVAEEVGLPEATVRGAENGRKLVTAFSKLTDLYGITADVTDGEVYEPEPRDDDPDDDSYEPAVDLSEAVPMAMPSEAVLTAQAAAWQAQGAQQVRQLEREREYFRKIEEALNLPERDWDDWHHTHAREIKMYADKMREDQRPRVEQVAQPVVPDPQVRLRQVQHLRSLIR